VKYAFIEEQRTQHAVRRLYRVLSVSHGGFYEWRGRAPSARARSDAALRTTIVAIHTESRRTYGRPRIHAELCARGILVVAHVGPGERQAFRTDVELRRARRRPAESDERERQRDRRKGDGDRRVSARPDRKGRSKRHGRRSSRSRASFFRMASREGD